MDRFERRSRVLAPAADLFAWHERDGAFARLQPPWERIEVVSQTPGGIQTSRLTARFKVGPVWLPMVAQHRDFIPGKQFRDEQVKGAFAHWVHTHTVEADGPDASVLIDSIEYALPMGPLGKAFGGGFARGKLDKMFTYRHAITQGDLERHQKVGQGRQWRICVLGSDGLLERSLRPFLTTGGHTLVGPGEKADALIGLAHVGDWPPNTGAQVLVSDRALPEGVAPRQVQVKLGTLLAHDGEHAPRGPWIALDDAIGVLHRALMDDSVTGVVEASTSQAAALTQSGFRLRFPTLDAAQAHELGR